MCFHVIGEQSSFWIGSKVDFFPTTFAFHWILSLFHWLMQPCFHTYPNRIQNWPTGQHNDNNSKTPLMPITTSNSVVYVPHCLQIHAWCTLLSLLASNGNLVHQYSSSNQFLLMLPSIVQYFMATNPPLYPAKVDCKPHTYVVSYTHYTILHHLNWNQENDPDMMYILFVQYVK